MTRFRFVSDHAEEYGVMRMCKVRKVSRSGYFDWKRRGVSENAKRDAELAQLIGEFHQRSRTTHGAPRVHAELRRLDKRCGKKRVTRLMAGNCLVAAHARGKWRRGRPDVALAPDLVNRDLTASRPDEIQAADVTQFWMTDGRLYFAGVESLWATLKRDLNWIYGRKTWASRDLLRSVIFDYIEGFYNHERIQKRLVYRSPADVESAAVV